VRQTSKNIGLTLADLAASLRVGRQRVLEIGGEYKLSQIGLR
jgi:hypothetical protein